MASINNEGVQRDGSAGRHEASVGGREKKNGRGYQELLAARPWLAHPGSPRLSHSPVCMPSGTKITCCCIVRDTRRLCCARWLAAGLAVIRAGPARPAAPRLLSRTRCWCCWRCKQRSRAPARRPNSQHHPPCTGGTPAPSEPSARRAPTSAQGLCPRPP